MRMSMESIFRRSDNQTTLNIQNIQVGYLVLQIFSQNMTYLCNFMNTQMVLQFVSASALFSIVLAFFKRSKKL